MEYCSLGDLSAFIKTKNISTDKQVNLRIAGPFGGLIEPIVFDFLRQLVSAVLFLRQHSLIHRDLKPQVNELKLNDRMSYCHLHCFMHHLFLLFLSFLQFQM
jgi:serine/threonine protein kinase